MINADLRLEMKSGDEKKILKLLEKGADLNVLDENGYNCLHKAVIWGNYKLISYLIKKGVDKEKKAVCFEHRPLHMIIYSRSKEKCLKVLLKHDVDVNAKDALGNTLLHLLMKYDPHNIRLPLIMLQNGCDPTLVNCNEDTCLHILALSRQHREYPTSISARKFIKKGVDMNRRNISKNETPLHIAIRRGNSYLVEILLTEGADLDVMDKRGATAFDKLCYWENITLKLITVFMKHIVLREHRGEEINEKIYRKIEDRIFITLYYFHYHREIKKLALVTVAPTCSVTYYDLLCQGDYKVAKYLKKREMRVNLSWDFSLLYLKQFCRALKQARKRLKYQDRAVEMLNFEIPNFCVENIVKFLEPEYLRKLSFSVDDDSFENENEILNVPCFHKCLYCSEIKIKD